MTLQCFAYTRAAPWSNVCILLPDVQWDWLGASAATSGTPFSVPDVVEGGVVMGGMKPVSFSFVPVKQVRYTCVYVSVTLM